MIGVQLAADHPALTTVPPTPTSPGSQQLCPTLQVGRAVGAGHRALMEFPEQVTAMIDRFLVTSLAVSPVP